MTIELKKYNKEELINFCEGQHKIVGDKNLIIEELKRDKQKLRYALKYAEKLVIANNMIKHCLELSDIEEYNWVYVDFVKEDRFMNEIMDESKVSISDNSSYELAEFALKQICQESLTILEDEYSNITP